MSGAHLIYRQTFELRLADAETANTLHNRIANMQARLAAQISDLFDRYSSSKDTLRIERLELDLGNIQLDQLENELINALRHKLPQSLQQAARLQAQQKKPQQQQSELLLIESLLTQARLPWWSPPKQRNLLEQSLIRAAQQPQPLKNLLQSLSTQTQAVQRLAIQPPRLLAQLLNLFSPGRGQDVRRMISTLLAATPLAQRRAFSQALWTAALQLIAVRHASRLSFWQALISQLAHNTGLSYSAQLAQLPQNGSVAGLVRQLQKQSPKSSAVDQHPAQSSATDLQWLSHKLPWLSALFKQLEQTPANHQTIQALLQTLRETANQTRQGPQLAALLHQLIQQALQSGLLDQTQHKNYAQQIEATLSTHHNKVQDDSGIALINAGVVMLWPFLSRFFQRQGLLQEEQFIDQAARNTAITLLHYLATGETHPVEYQLPLNKLLCGLDIDQYWQLEASLNQAQCDACDQLLDALITQAAMFGELSVDGLRGSFLLRAGSLSQDSGHWLLRVERQSYDVLLERLPWPMNWIKLPWMNNTLEVIW